MKYQRTFRKNQVDGIIFMGTIFSKEHLKLMKELGNVVTPAIISIHFHYKTTGMEVAKLLLEILQSGTDVKKQIKMGYQLVEKASTRS